MGYAQPATPAQSDNTTALGFVTKNLNPRATKPTDMNNWYMRDKQDQKQFRYDWREGPKMMQTTKQNTTVQRTIKKKGLIISLRVMGWTRWTDNRAKQPSCFELAKGCARYQESPWYQIQY